jgi:hypothetical protein
MSKNFIKATPIAKDFSPGFASLWLVAILVMFFIALLSVSRDGFNQKVIGVLVVFSPLLAFGFWMSRPYIKWWLRRIKLGTPTMQRPEPFIRGAITRVAFAGIPESAAREGLAATLVAEVYSEGTKDSPSWDVCLRTQPVRVYTQRETTAKGNTFSGQNEAFALPTTFDLALLPIGSVRWSIELTRLNALGATSNMGFKFALPKAVSQPLA